MSYLLIVLGILGRMLPHPANFTPVGAAAIFATDRLGWKKALPIVLLTFVITDIFLKFSYVTVFVYVGMFGYIVFAQILKRKTEAKTKFQKGLQIGSTVLLVPILGSLFFFLVSNFGVWVGPWYPHTLAGLTNCYILALPFYQNTLYGDIIFTVSIFSIYAIYKKYKIGDLLWQRLFRKQILTKKS